MNAIWETKDGRYAVSLMGERCGTYQTQEAAEQFLMAAKSLGGFLNAPISGEQMKQWSERDRLIRKQYAKEVNEGAETEGRADEDANA